MNKQITKTLLSHKPKYFGFIIAVLLLFICATASLLYWSGRLNYELLTASQEKVFTDAEFYRLITSLFIHGDLQHLLSNSYMLFILSYFVFGTLAKDLTMAVALLIYTGLGAAITSGLSLLNYAPNINLIGISGMVYLLAGFWFTSFLMIHRKYSFKGRLLRVIGTSLVILFPTSFEETTSYIAHFHGFWIGITMAFGYFYFYKDWIRSYEEIKYELDEEFFEVLE